jgi:hypothetical protein
MGIRRLTDEEADAMWELKIPMLRKFPDLGEAYWTRHVGGTSPAEDRRRYSGNSRWEFAVEVE